MSCHSCHTEGHTCGLKSDTLGDGSYGASKKIPSLLGVGTTGPWTWTGSMERLEDNEGHVDPDHNARSEARRPPNRSGQYTGIPQIALPLSPRLTSGEHTPDAATLAWPHSFFKHENATPGHAPPEYTSPERFDVGLTDEVGNRRFNPPSLHE